MVCLHIRNLGYENFTIKALINEGQDGAKMFKPVLDQPMVKAKISLQPCPNTYVGREKSLQGKAERGGAKLLSLDGIHISIVWGIDMIP